MRNVPLTPEQIGQKIKKLRIEKGFAQNEFAERLGKSVRTLQKYESGDINMSLETLKELAELLEVPAGALILDEQPGVHVQTFADLISSFFALNEADGIGVEIEEVTTKDNRKVLAVYCDAASEEFPYNNDVCDFLKEYSFYKSGRENGILPEDIYQTWEKKTLIAADERTIYAKKNK